MSSVLAVDESPGKMYALAVVLMLLAVIAVMLRIQARRMMKASIAWDDFLVVIALVRLEQLLATLRIGTPQQLTMIVVVYDRHWSLHDCW